MLNGAVLCVCWRGFQLPAGSRKCVDIDECQTFGLCGQQCMNTRGSYKCHCDQGYVSVGVDGKHCKAKGGFSLVFQNKTIFNVEC